MYLIIFLVTVRSQGQKNKKALKNQGFSRLYLFYSPYLVAEAGFEPHDLRVMSPTSYQAALLRDIGYTLRKLVPETGVEPARYFRITGF